MACFPVERPSRRAVSGGHVPRVQDDGADVPPPARAVAEMVADGHCCDIWVVASSGNGKQEKIAAVRVLLAAVSPVLRTLILPATTSFDRHGSSKQPANSNNNATPLTELHLPHAVSLKALRCVVAYSCGAVPHAWLPAISECPGPDLDAAASALHIPDLQAWCSKFREEEDETHKPLLKKVSRLSTRHERLDSAILAKRHERLDSVLLAGSSIIIAATSYAWWPALSYNMRVSSQFMDDAMIRKNPNVYEPIDWHRLFRTDYWGLEMFVDGIWTHKSFRPLTILTFRFNYWMHTFDTSGFHITNILFHLASSIILGIFGTNAMKLQKSWALLLVALFWAHPVHTESVLYIVGRADLLCCYLVFHAALVYAPCVSGKTTGLTWNLVRVLISTVLLVAAGLCKETGFCFFGLLAGWEILNLLQQAGRHSMVQLVRLGVLLAFGFLACWTRCWYTGGTGIERMDPHSNPIAAEEDRWTRILSYSLIHGVYAKLLVWPTFLCYDYSLDAIPLVRTIADVRLLLSVTSYLAFGQLLTCAMRRLRPTALKTQRMRRLMLTRGLNQVPIVGLAILVLSFGPMSNIFFPVGTVIGERLLYIPSAGLLLTLVGLGSVSRGRIRKCVAVLMLVAGGAGAFLTYLRVPEWQSADSITTADGMKQLRSTRVQFNYGNIQLQDKRYDEALFTYQRAILLDPTDHDSLPLYHAGQILFFQGRNIEAESYLHKAVSGYYSPLTIKEEEIFHDYALALWFAEKPEESILNFHKSLTMNPTFTKSLNNLGCAAGIGALTGKLSREYLNYGLEVLQKALQVEPTNILYWRNAVALLLLGGDQQAATAAWQQVSALDPQGSLAGPPQECSWEFYFR